ncbi:MAG: hypothetical protein MJ220_00255 [Bacilli bacterium]|nr:hypothetical protein [Bacilli bacterium]
MDYRKDIEKLNSQLRIWKTMIIVGAVLGGILFMLAVYYETAGVLEDNEGLYAIGNLIAVLAGFPLDVMVAGIILNAIWRRRIINRVRLMSETSSNDAPKEDPLSDFVNKDDPFH